MGVHNVANKDEFDAALRDNKIVVVDAYVPPPPRLQLLAETKD